MRHTLSPLAHLFRSLVETGQGGGYPRDRWELRDQIVAAGISRRRAEEAVAEAFPFPHTPDEAYASGVLWGSNYVGEGPWGPDFDEEGAPPPPRWYMKIIQESRWIKRFVEPLRIKWIAFDQESSQFPQLINIDIDGMIKVSLAQLGVGGNRINWELIEDYHRAEFLAGVIDSTCIVVVGKFNKSNDEFNRYYETAELVLDADEFCLASAVCAGIEGAELCESFHYSDHSLNDQQGPFGIKMTGQSIRWFFNNVFECLQFSIIKEEKNKIHDFDSANKFKPNTGIRLTKGQKKTLKEWVRRGIRKQPEITSRRLCHESKTLIGRTISMVTAWKILTELSEQLELEMITTRPKRKARSSRIKIAN